jgi:hypothetical protein
LGTSPRLPQLSHLHFLSVHLCDPALFWKGQGTQDKGHGI